MLDFYTRAPGQVNGNFYKILCGIVVLRGLKVGREEYNYTYRLKQCLEKERFYYLTRRNYKRHLVYGIPDSDKGWDDLAIQVSGEFYYGDTPLDQREGPRVPRRFSSEGRSVLRCNFKFSCIRYLICCFVVCAGIDSPQGSPSEMVQIEANLQALFSLKDADRHWEVLLGKPTKFGTITVTQPAAAGQVGRTPVAEPIAEGERSAALPVAITSATMPLIVEDYELQDVVELEPPAKFQKLKKGLKTNKELLPEHQENGSLTRNGFRGRSRCLFLLSFSKTKQLSLESPSQAYAYVFLVRPEPIHNEKMPCHTKSYQLQKIKKVQPKESPIPLERECSPGKRETK